MLQNTCVGSWPSHVHVGCASAAVGAPMATHWEKGKHIHKIEAMTELTGRKAKKDGQRKKL